MRIAFDSVAELEQSLKDAAEAHGRHEQEIGHEDAEWPSWYAQHMWDERAAAAGSA